MNTVDFAYRVFFAPVQRTAFAYGYGYGYWFSQGMAVAGD